MSTEVAKRDSKDQLAVVRDLLTRSQANIQQALPRHIRPEQMIRVVLTSVQRTPELLKCEPITLIGAVFQAAQLGLVPDGVLGQAYLVPFRNNKKNRMEVQFIPGYKGLIALARRSGDISTIGAEVVRERDKFTYKLGIDPVLDHEPSDSDDPGALVRVYAYAKLRDGGHQIVVLNKRQVMAIRARSQSARSQSSPWVTDEEWMWKKTALKQLCKLLPASTEQAEQLQQAIALEERAELNLPQDLALMAQVPEAERETPTPEDGHSPVRDDQPVSADNVTAADVMRAATDVGWDAKKLSAFIKARFQKDVTGLAKGAECAKAIEAIQAQDAIDLDRETTTEGE